MRRAVGLAALLVLAAVGPAAVAGADVEVSVEDVTVSPAQPAPGDTITVTATVRNAETSNQSYTVNAVALRTRSGELEEYARSENLGTIAPGGSMEVPLTVSFDESGQRFLRVVVYGEDEAGRSERVEYPVTIDVRERAPLLSIDAENAVVGSEADVSVTVANGLDDPLRNVELTLSGVGPEKRRVAAEQAPGTSERYEFSVTPEDAGPQYLTATLRYETADGRERTTERTLTLDATPLRRTVDLDVSAVGDGRTTALRATLSNRGNAPIENVTLRATGTNASIPSVSIPRVAATSQRTVALNVSGLDGSGQFPVTVVATYDSTGESRRISDEAALLSRPGRIRLTGLDVEREEGSLHVVGSASNLGLTAADGVVISVRSSETVEPAYPGREYFVGTVPASDFVSFDVYADAEANATSIPLEVSYLVDGREVTRRTEVPIERDSAPSPSDTGGGGRPGVLVPLAIGLVVVLVAGGFSYVAWRNYRGDT